jgi:hypothetical protein
LFNGAVQAEQRPFPHAVRDLTGDEDHLSLGVGVDPMAVRLEQHRPARIVQAADMTERLTDTVLVVRGRVVNVG